MVSTDDLPDDMRKPVGTNWVGPGGHFVHYPVRSGKLLNFVGIAERDDWSVESWTVQGSADEFANDFRGWHKNIQTLIERTGRPFKWALKTRNPMPKWSGERVTLLGDACHASLPFLAQGAVMAIEDGFVLARAVEKYGDDYARAFRVYEEARKERTARVMRGSADNIKRFHDNRLSDASAAKRYVDEEWSEEKVKNRYEWLFLYRADQVAI
jgi:salicylate hydroxylase